ncbi:MAG: 1,4-dihydroxy-2-naphthoate polyprenyltransferase [Actinobacteria bacterium]|nr:1,4-dihydroxy-2-naphthoate polyprenyltransferase [Actinomycetota bacterium]MCL6105469.1 1,4-dihydroxy-2-naphthoate polyprenyltransferase [Actinomycetota bacterium]
MNRWIIGARTPTLPASLVPVVVGTGVAANYGEFVLSRAVTALVVALGLQLGINYINDYQDGIRGTDTNRVGPTRLVGSGLATPKAVLVASSIAFGIAGVAGLILAWMVTWWLIPVGLACILVALTYTGGPWPYGYHGFAEVFVFVFFGLVATCGTAFVQMDRLSWLAFLVAVPVGMSITAILIANNLRDLTLDAKAGKVTLAVRIGEKHTKNLYATLMVGACLWSAVLAVSKVELLFSILALPMAVLCVKKLNLINTLRFTVLLGLILTLTLWIR